MIDEIEYISEAEIHEQGEKPVRHTRGNSSQNTTKNEYGN